MIKQEPWVGSPWIVMAKMLNYKILVSLNSSQVIMFTFGLLTLWERYEPPYPSSYYYCWVSKMVISVYGLSGGEVLCDWIYESRDEPRNLGAKIQNPVWQIPPDVPWGGGWGVL